MGLVSNNNRTFLGVADGKITQKAEETTPGAVKSEKDGKTYYKLHHDAIEGVLTSIAVKENEFNGQVIKSWVLTLSDMGDTYQLEVNVKGGYGSSLIKALANPVIDFTQPIRLQPWAKTVNNVKKSAMYVSQAGNQIDWYFTKDNPNGLPEPKVVKFEGKDKWDWYDQLQFLEQFVKNTIAPKLKAAAPVYKTPEYAPPADISSAPEDDDLPF